MDSTRAATTLYVTLAVADTALAGASEADAPAWPARARRLTKPLLMPALAWAFSTSTHGSRDPLRRATLVAQGLSGVGDVALLGHGDRSFLAGLGGFLGAHVAYVHGFTHAGTATGAGDAALGTDSDTPGTPGGVRAAATLFLVAGPAMGYAAGRTSPRLRLPVVAYVGALCAMAASASRIGPPATRADRRTVLAGTCVFLVSDSVLGAREFVVGTTGGRTRRVLDVLVMATYTAAQGLIATGVTQVVRSRQETGTTSS